MKKQMSLLVLMGILILPAKNTYAGLAIFGSGAGTYIAYEYSLLPLGYAGCTFNGECGGNKVLGFLSLLVGLVFLDGEGGVEPSFSELTIDDLLTLDYSEDEVQDVMSEFNESIEEINIQKRNVTRSLLAKENITQSDVELEWKKQEHMLSPVVFEVISRIRTYNMNISM